MLTPPPPGGKEPGDALRPRRGETARPSTDVGRPHVLRPKSHADESSGDPAQERESPQEPQGPRGGELCTAPDHAAEDPVLDEHLEALGDPGRELPPPLHPPEV